MESKESFSDRLDQTFKIFFNNPKLLIIISSLYGFLYILNSVVSKYFIKQFILEKDFFYNTTNLYIILRFHIYYIILAIFYMCIYLGLIKTINNIYNGKNVDFQANISYGFNNIINSFATYYHIFMYVYFIPSILLIVGLGLILIDLINNKIGIKTIGSGYFNLTRIPDFSRVERFYIGLLLVLISFFLGFYFFIYRGLKSSFAITRAVDQKDFSKNSFEVSIKFTKNNWWRICGNFIIFFIITGIIFGILNSLLALLNGYIYQSGMDITKIKSFDPLIIKSLIYSFFNIDIGSFLQSCLSGLQAYIGVIFVYLLYKRLEKEDGGQIWIENGSQDILKQDFRNLGTEDL